MNYTHILHIGNYYLAANVVENGNHYIITTPIIKLVIPQNNTYIINNTIYSVYNSYVIRLHPISHDFILDYTTNSNYNNNH